MWNYEKGLQYPVKITKTNPKIAQIILTQYGGPDGELGASMRYLSQRYTMPYKEVTGILTDIGTEERAQKRYRYFFLPIIMWNYTLSYILLATIICSNPAAWNLDPDVIANLADVLAGYTRALLERTVAVSMFPGIDCQLFT